MPDRNGASATDSEPAFFSAAEESPYGDDDDDAPLPPPEHPHSHSHPHSHPHPYPYLHPYPHSHPYPHGPAPDHRPPWHEAVSASFAQLSRQFATVSHAPALLERLHAIEDGQRRLGREVEALREQFAAVAAAAAAAPVPAPEPELEPAPEPEPEPEPTTTATLADLEAELKEQKALFILDQTRLPVRLQNALAAKSLSPVRMLPMRNGKLPANAPSTRGEFEHLTKERYEAIMECYDIPIAGDTTAKRDTLRAFLGIPPDPPKRK